MIKDEFIYRNLENQVEYLTDYLNTEAQLVELGIKVVGTAEKREDIPEGQYEFGDAYMIGTSEPYIMWVWTRADRTHPQDYWFEAGPFPMPGPQGPKGDGLEQITKWINGTVSGVTYDTTNGAKVTQTTKIDYIDSTNGSTKQQQFDTTTTLPIAPGKYIGIGTNHDNNALEVKVDDTALALDYYKIDKSVQAANSTSVYVPSSGTTTPMYVTFGTIPNSIASRDSKGDCSFHKLNFEFIGFKGGGSEIDYYSLYMNTVSSDYTIDKTPTDTGTLTNTQLAVLQHTDQSKNLRIVYDNQVYYRMESQRPSDDTLKYIHIDSIDDENGGYKATGKCFSITVSTRAWKVVDLDFGGSTRTTHNLTLTNSSTGTNIYFSLTNNRPETYEEASAVLLEALENSSIACTVDANGTYSAGIITTDGTNFEITYGNGEQILIEQMQVSITDSMV